MIPYEKYKDSGVAWIGEVPEHWEVKRLKYVADAVQTGSTPPSNQEEYFREEIDWFTPSDFSGEIVLKDSKRKISSSALSDNLVKLFPSNTVMMVGIGATLGKIGLIETPASSNQQINAIIINDKNTARFVAYFLHVNQQNVLSLTNASTLPILNQSQTKDIFFPLPPLPEQTAIARYLDQKTGEIDQLIAQKERLLALWEEEKTAVINQAVTRGLDAGARMKDSGVAWLGEVPEHWEVKRLKYVVKKIGSGVTPKGGAEVYKTFGIPLLRSQNIHFDGLRLNDVVFISEEIHDEMSNSKVRAGDVLLNITGASIGRTYFIDDNLGEANVNQHVCILRPNESIDTKFLYLILRSSIGQKQIEFEQTGSGREGLNFSALQNFQIPFLKIPEQTAIVRHIETQTARIQTQMNQTRKLIELLKEYRATLISEVVTGKIKITE